MKYLILFFLSTGVLHSQDMPSLSPVIISIGQQEESTGIEIKKGDFVCFLASGLIASENHTSYSTSGTKTYKAIPPTGDPELSRANVVESSFLPGALYARLNDQVVVTRSLLSEDEGLAALGVGVLVGSGGYFIAESDGVLKFMINDDRIAKNSFNIEIYTLTAAQHLHRNRFNECPERLVFLETTHRLLGTSVEVISPAGTEWYRDDEASVRKYHGGNPTFRGLGALSGTQCCFKEVERAVKLDGDWSKTEQVVYQLVKGDGIDIGTFDYGYYGQNVSFPASIHYGLLLGIHFALDVYPHRAYLKQDPNFKYKGGR